MIRAVSASYGGEDEHEDERRGDRTRDPGGGLKVLISCGFFR